MKNTVKIIKEKLFTTILLVSVFFFCIPGIELIPNTKSILKSDSAEAAVDYGRETKTAEFLLGLGTETSSRASGVVSYTTATGWVTAAPAVSTGDAITLFGKNIHVDSAQLEASFYTTAAAMQKQDIYLNVEKSATDGRLAAAGEYAGMTANTLATGGLTGSIQTLHDVTSFFDRQTDTDFSSGVHIVSSLNVVGPTRFLTSMKMIITYSVDVETISHTLTKTVKLPLLSAANRGTKNTTCAASATCVFTFDLSKIPELTNKNQIDSLEVQMFAQEGATTVADSMSLRMTGSGTSRQYIFADTYTDTYTARVLWNPLSDAQFTVGGVESIDVVNGTTALYALGGEVTITYTYDSAAPVLTDTIEYFVSQGTTLPTNVLTQLSTSTVNIVNNSAQIKTAWYHVDVSPSVVTANVTFGHRIKSNKGNSIGTDVSYALNTANTRVARAPTLIHVLDESGAMYSTSTDMGGKYQFSVTAGSSPSAVTAYITFTYDNSDPLLPRTKTAIFGASQKGPGRNTASNVKTTATIINLAEHAVKKEESAFIETDYLRHDTTSITGSGNHTTKVGQKTLAIPEGGYVEPYRKKILFDIPANDFFGAATSSAQSFPLSIAQYYSTTDYAYEANYIYVTYSVGFEIKPEASAKQLRTVEYILGGGSDDTARAAGVTQYIGDGSFGASPSMLPIQLLGNNVRVKNAYVDTTFTIAVSATAETVNEMYLTGAITGYGGSQADVYFHENSGSQFISSPSGYTGYYHGQNDVTALFGKQIDDGYWNRGDVQVMFGISTNQSVGNRTLTSMKLVVTYETDFTLNWHDEIKTVRIPLQSTDSLGTRSAVCAMAANCNFTYSRSLPDMVDVVSAYFDVTASMDGTVSPSIYMASNGAQSLNLTNTEVNNDSTAIKYLWQIPNANLNATTTQGQTGTLTFHNSSASALNFYGVGGELVITYKYNTASTKQLETVSYSVGQQSAGVFAKTLIGTSTPYIANKGATARDVWIKYYSAPYAPGNLTLYGKLGTSVERSLVASSTVATRSSGDRVYYLNLSQDIANFNFPSTNITASIAFTSGAQYPTGAETFINYIWDGSMYGTTTKTVSYSSAQHSVTNVSANAPQVRNANIYLPSIVPKTFRGAYSRTLFQHGAGGTYGGTFTTGLPIVYGINNATTSVTEIGDAFPYNNTLISSYNQSTLFGPSISDYYDTVRVENSSQTVNAFRFSNEILISYDEIQDTRRAAFTQDAFRIYMNEDSVTPTKPWHTDLVNPLGESQDMTSSQRPVRKSDVVRLRMGLTVGTSTLLALNQSFQLQYGAKTASCSAIDIDWQNVGVGNAWIGNNNPSVNSSTALPSLLISKSNVAATYEEDGLTGLNPNQVNMNQMMEYDFSFKRNTATPDTDYCFRMVESTGKKLSGYQFYPTIRTAGYTPETTNWKWYDDELNETPVDNPNWLQNSTANSLANNNIIKLRVGLLEVANEAGINEKFALQFSTDPTFVSGAQYIDSQSSCNISSTFCYANSPAVGDDNDALLSISKFGILKGRHNEATSTSTFSPAANSHYEMEYSIKPVRQRTGQVYYFRLYDIKRDAPILVNITYSSPSVQAEGATLGVTVSGVSSGVSIDGNIMSASTTNTLLPFGNLVLDKSTFLSQLLNIKTNAVDGYTVRMYANDELRNENGDIIPSITAGNDIPNSWENSCSALGLGCIGYHTSDGSLSPMGDSARFSATNTWARLSTTTPEEISFSNLPTQAVGEDVNIIYRVVARISTQAGLYSTDVVYVTTPVY